jgi:hypothetical protein
VALVAADEVTMKNGQKVDGHVQALKDGHLEVGVFTGQHFAGFPAMATNKLKFSNVRSIKFDGRDDFFAIVKKNEEVLDARVYELSKGKLPSGRARADRRLCRESSRAIKTERRRE